MNQLIRFGNALTAFAIISITPSSHSAENDVAPIKPARGSKPAEFDREHINQHWTDNEAGQADPEERCNRSCVVNPRASIRPRDDAKRNRDGHSDQQRRNRQFDGGRVTFEYEIDNRAIVSKGKSEIAVKNAAPIISITIVRAVPLEMSIAARVPRKREEEGRAIEPVLLPELRELLGRGLFAQNGDGRIARHEFHQQRHERDNGPNDEQKDCDAAQRPEGFVLCGRAHLCESG